MKENISKSELILNKINEIEAELQSAGMWQLTPLTPEQLDFQQPFGMDKLSYEQWLQFVLVPMVHGKLESNQAFPSSSMVGTKAIKEFDGNEKAAKLVTLLCEFDSLFG